LLLFALSWAAEKDEEISTGQQEAVADTGEAVAEQEQLSAAPDFQLKDLAGQRVVLSELLGKGPILISFWATWCKPCVKELPHLNDLYKKYKDRGLLVMAISEDGPRSLSKVQSFVAGNRWDFLVLLDDNCAVQRKFNFRAVPYVVLLDKDGRIVHSRMGYRPGDENVLEEKLLPLLSASDVEDQGQIENNSSGGAQGTEATEEESQGSAKEKVKKDRARTESAEGHDD
jgi:peroxiredoxin